MAVGDRTVILVTVATNLAKWFRVQDKSLCIHYHLNLMLQSYYTNSWRPFTMQLVILPLFTRVKGKRKRLCKLFKPCILTCQDSVTRYQIFILAYLPGSHGWFSCKNCSSLSRERFRLTYGLLQFLVVATWLPWGYGALAGSLLGVLWPPSLAVSLVWEELETTRLEVIHFLLCSPELPLGWRWAVTSVSALGYTSVVTVSVDK